jgi:SOS-response transcriptional repressor LexA
MVVVRGRSMLPGLRPGDRLVVRQGRTPRVGDVVLARLRDGTVVVKRVAERRPAGWWLLSDNAAEGLGDSRAHGAVPDADVWGVAVLRAWPRPRILGRRAPGPL